MYTYIYIYIYVYIHTYVYVYTYVCIHIYICTCVYIYIQIQIPTHTQTETESSKETHLPRHSQPDSGKQAQSRTERVTLSRRVIVSENGKNIYKPLTCGVFRRFLKFRGMAVRLTGCSVLQCVAVCCCVLLCDAVCCGVLQ